MVRYTIAAYKHDTTLIKGIQDSEISPGIEQLISSGSGAVDPSFASVGRLQPQITFTSTAIKTILAALGIDGAAIASDKVWFQKMADDGLRAGALAHIQATMANGIIIPTQITARQGQEATISCQVVPRSADGTASPLAMITNASLESGQDLVSEVYTLGDISINGTELEGVDDWTLDFGIDLDITFGSGHVYPTMVGVMSRAPSFTATTFDIAKFTSWTEAGIAQDASDSIVKLLDQVEGGVRGSSPITFTIDAGRAHFERVGGSHGTKASGSVRITPVSDGVAAIIALGGLT